MFKLFFCIVLSTLLVGCGWSKNKDIPTVNGEKLTAQQVDDIISSIQNDTLAYSTQNTIRKLAIDTLVNQTLLKQEAEFQGIIISEQELDKRYKNTLRLWLSDSKQHEILKKQGFTIDNMKSLLRNQMSIQALSDKLGKVTEEEVISYYNAHSNNYTLYTVKRYATKSEQEARDLVVSSTKLYTITIPASQLPNVIKRKLHEGSKFDKLEVIKIDEETWWVFSIINKEDQSLSKVENEVRRSAEAERRLSRVQELLKDLKSKSKIVVEN